MEAFRKWLFKPKREDESLFAQFFYADEELNAVAAELDSFDGRKHPERCTKLVSRLRHCQDKVLNICTDIMDEIIFEERSHRDFRVKFPDDILQDNLSGQLWFGAECLAAGSSIINREIESAHMRPLAKAVTKSLDNVRSLLREQCFKHIPEYTEKIRESLKIFDRLFAEFELEYVSAMVPVKSVHEYDLQQDVVVLFSETLDRALEKLLVNQDSVDNCDPSLMFTIPRLAIIYGLVINPEGPLNLDKAPQDLSQMFRPFRNLLKKVKELLLGLSIQDISVLEQCLCSEGGSDQLHIKQNSNHDIYLETKENNFLIESHLRSMNNEGSNEHSNYNPRPGMDTPIFEIDEVISNPDDSKRKSESDLQGGTNLLEESLNSLSQESPPTAARASDQLYSEDLSDNDDCSTAQDSLSSTDSYASAEFNDDIKVAYHMAKSAIQLDVSSSPASTSNLLHKLFVCISGVADQLQTNFAGDLSNILKSVFLMHSTGVDEGSLNEVETAEDALTSPSSSVHNPPSHNDVTDPEEILRTTASLSNNYSTNLGSIFYSSLSLDANPAPPYTLYPNTALPDASLARIFTSLLPHDNSEGLLILQEIMSTTPPHLCYSLGEDHQGTREGPSWIPDSQVTKCMACDLPFTVIRRRHHCRNCGKVFCSKCSGNNVPLPHIGHNDPVRVCNSCFMFHIAPFFMQGAL